MSKPTTLISEIRVSERAKNSVSHPSRFALRDLLLFTFFCTWPGPHLLHPGKQHLGLFCGNQKTEVEGMLLLVFKVTSKRGVETWGFNESPSFPKSKR